jgi:nitroreductase
MPHTRTPLADRFGPDAADIESGADAPLTHRQLAARGSVRKFRPDAVPYATMRRLCALALCAPTKSDLQQRDIIIIDAPSLKSQIAALLTDGPLGQKWLAEVPNLLVFCGNNRRQRRIHVLRDIPFANDHLDAFFNAAVDA